VDTCRPYFQTAFSVITKSCPVRINKCFSLRYTFHPAIKGTECPNSWGTIPSSVSTSVLYSLASKSWRASATAYTYLLQPPHNPIQSNPTLWNQQLGARLSYILHNWRALARMYFRYPLFSPSGPRSLFPEQYSQRARIFPAGSQGQNASFSDKSGVKLVPKQETIIRCQEGLTGYSKRKFEVRVWKSLSISQIS